MTTQSKVLKRSRSGNAGIQLGKVIREMADLMYQNNTKSNFYKGLNEELQKEEIFKEIVPAKEQNESMLKLLKRYRELFDCRIGHCERNVCNSECQLCWDVGNLLMQVEGDA